MKPAMSQSDQVAHAQIDQAAADRRDHKLQTERLQRKVDDIEQRLANADSFKNFLIKRIDELKQLVLGLVGQTRSVANVDPSQSCLDSYLSIFTMELAIKDAPRVRQHILAELDAAQVALDEHERNAPK
jgi:hypothetical protein